MTRISNTADETSLDYVKNFTKRMLKTHLFIGTFQEKRFVEPLHSYRDVVKIDSEEKLFIENVMAVKKKLKQELARYSSSNNPVWIGITDSTMIGAPVGYSLWVVLPVEVFGKYWFKVRTVEFLNNEIRLKLDVVRPVKTELQSDIKELEDQSIDLKTTVHDVSKNLKINMLTFVKNYLTFNNVKESLVFVILLMGTGIAGGANIIKFLMEYLLKLIQELTGFIKACTPIIITVLNIVGKTIYGLYALIITLWFGKSTLRQQEYTYYPKQINHINRRALPYRGSVTITPLDD